MHKVYTHVQPKTKKLSKTYLVATKKRLIICSVTGLLCLLFQNRGFDVIIASFYSRLGFISISGRLAHKGY